MFVLVQTGYIPDQVSLNIIQFQDLDDYGNMAKSVPLQTAHVDTNLVCLFVSVSGTTSVIVPGLMMKQKVD